LHEISSQVASFRVLRLYTYIFQHSCY